MSEKNTEFDGNAAIQFRTNITREELMTLFTDFLNRGLFTLGSGLLSVHQDVEASTFLDICTAAGESSREHPLVIIAATGARATELKKFYEEHKDADGNPDPLPTNHRKLFLELPETPEEPKIVIP